MGTTTEEVHKSSQDLSKGIYEGTIIGQMKSLFSMLNC
jgi:hypothetical protein